MSYRWTVERFLQGWCPDPIPASLRFPPVPVPPAPPVIPAYLISTFEAESITDIAEFEAHGQLISDFELNGWTG